MLCSASRINQLRSQAWCVVRAEFARRCGAAQSSSAKQYPWGSGMFARLPAAGLVAVFMLAACGRADSTAQGAPASSAAGISWTKFTDPAEKAFAVEVPQGWSIRGGMFRMGFSDARAMVDMTSPHGRINVRLGDVSVASYVLPGPHHERPGQLYDLGAQARWSRRAITADRSLRFSTRMRGFTSCAATRRATRTLPAWRCRTSCRARSAPIRHPPPRSPAAAMPRSAAQRPVPSPSPGRAPPATRRSGA